MKPTLSELEKFEDQPEGIDLEVVTESGQCGAGMRYLRGLSEGVHTVHLMLISRAGSLVAI